MSMATSVMCCGSGMRISLDPRAQILELPRRLTHARRHLRVHTLEEVVLRQADPHAGDRRRRCPAEIVRHRRGGSPSRRPDRVPAITFNISATSRAVHASGPRWSMDHDSTMAPARLTRPYVGLSPTTPQQPAGSRMEPPVSEPTAPAKKPAATPAPEPLDEPPVACPATPRIVDITVMGVVAEGAHRELGHVELAQADGAGVEKPPRRRTLLRRREVLRACACRTRWAGRGGGRGP